jgi:signal transduction histidine kinase
MVEPDRIARESLQTQAALAPYALASFVVGLLLLVAPTLRATQPLAVLQPLAGFAAAAVVFLVAIRWTERRANASVAARARVHVLAGLVWAAALLPLTAFAESAGPARDTLLLLTFGAAVLIVFFTAPHLPSLLLVGPAAAAGPLWALRSADGTMLQGAMGAVALALTLALILNRSHRRQFALTLEREALTAQRAAALAHAERLARDKSALISTLSSQVRSGLAGVEQTLATAAAARRGRTPARDPLGSALDGLRELSTVVDTALDSEEAEAGRLVLRPEPFDLVALCAGLVEEHRAAAHVKGFDLELSLEGDLLGAAVADPRRVRQVLAALLGNAVRYTVRGRVELRVARDADGVRLSVSDTGPGLNPVELADALQPFRRVERTCAGVPGAGLGLSLASRLAALMGSELRADSAPGVGSRFGLRLPFDPAALVVAPASTEEPLRVLTAGGDALSAALLRSLLDDLGHKVVHAAQPHRALGLARRAEFDLVVVDIAEEDPAALAVLRAEPALAAVPLIALLDAPGDDGAGLMAAGADVVMRKPPSAAALAQALAEATRLRTAEVRAAA